MEENNDLGRVADGEQALVSDQAAAHLAPSSFDPSRVLTIPVNGVYFDQIAAGTKLEEYRLVNDYWAKRLEHKRIDRIVLTRGYPKGGGIEGVTRLTRQWNGFTPKTITHPHFGPEPAFVYAIDVSEPASGISASGQDAERLEAKPASPVGKAETPKAHPINNQVSRMGRL